MADVLCPRCGAAMRERKGSRGVFLSCSTYPACKGTRDIGGAAPAGPPKVAPPPVIGVPPGAQPIWQMPPAASTMDGYQQAVADWREGFSVVSAAAGSGKSYTLIQRTLSLLREGVVPESICILVYNRDAAELLRNRLSEAAGPQAKRVQIFTFHAWCYALLRHWYPNDVRLAVGRIIGTADAPHVAKLVAPLISELRLDDDMEWGPASMCSERITEALVDLSGPAAAEALSRAMGWCAKGTEFTAAHQKQAEPFVAFCRAWRDRKRRDNYIEFCDMLAEVARAIQAAPEAPHVAHLAQMYAHVMVDEAQDISLPRAVIATHLAKGARSSLWVGDARQCQPAGTMVRTPEGSVPIESLTDGAKVCAWVRSDGTVQQQGSVVRVASRRYSGLITTVRVGDLSTRTTATHRWLVRWDPAVRKTLTAVYVMRRTLPGIGTCFRIGWCKVIDESHGQMFQHYKLRARLEEADALWIVKTTHDRAEASAWESIYSTRYQIPTVMFNPVGTTLYTEETLRVIWQECASASREGAHALLRDCGLLSSHPFYDAAESERGRKTLFVLPACNLVDGLMVPVAATRTYAWQPLQLQREFVEELPVYSLDVAKHGAYVADGICTLNSIYLFTGARPDILLNAVAEGATLHTLPVNRRSTKRIVAAANVICRGREWHVGGDCLARPDAALGELVQVHVDATPADEAARVIEDLSRRVAAGLPLGTVEDANYCLLARTNAMLVDLECAFVARNIPVRLQGCAGGLWGTNVGQQLLAYLEAIEGVPSWGLMSVMNKPKRYCTRADVEAALTAGQQREKAGQPADLFRTLKASKGKGAQRLGEELARAAGKPWQVRCAQAAKWLGVEDGDDKVSGGEDRKAALLALVELAQQLGSLRAIYDYKVQAAKGDKLPAVLLSTIHSAKGKEWPVVYVCGVRSRKLPHERCEDEEEERRLFYVACTRARDVLQIGTGGVPSRFLIELGWATQDEGSMLTDAV